MSTFHRITVVRYGFESKSAKFRDTQAASDFISEAIRKQADIIIHADKTDRVTIIKRGTAEIPDECTLVGPYEEHRIVPFELDSWEISDEFEAELAHTSGGVAS